MTAFMKILIAAGFLLLVIGVKWGLGWVLIGGFVALLLACAIPIFRFVFARNN